MLSWDAGEHVKCKPEGTIVATGITEPPDTAFGIAELPDTASGVVETVNNGCDCACGRLVWSRPSVLF